ncbi:MAG: threonine/serine dehydratase [Pseudomonadota bacterium]
MALLIGCGAMMLTNERMAAARERCVRQPDAVVATPCVHSRALSGASGADVYLKYEHCQRTGSFKYRGALNKLRQLIEQQMAPTIVAASSGNHGLAVATAAKVCGLSAIVYVPASADPAKQRAIAAAGATLITVEGDSLLAELTARRAAEDRDAVFVSPYNDIDVVAGQSTIGSELLEQCPDADMVIAAVGGGGLLSGIGSAMRAGGSQAAFVGVWPAVACSMYRCLQAGQVINVAEAPTWSDGTAGGVEPGAVTLPILADVLDEQWLVDEDRITAAMRWLAIHEHMIVEGSAALAVAPLLERHPAVQGKRVIAVLCGRNIDYERFQTALQQGATAA